MRIIPAIDILNGKCVRLTKGNYSTSKIYNENPLEVAKEFEANGIRYLHLVDLDGARSHRIINQKVLFDIASGTNLIIDFGGGIKHTDDLTIAFNNGANQVTIGSIAVQEPDLFNGWMKLYGTNKIILGADCNKRKIMSMGWEKESDLDVIDFIKSFQLQGVKNVVCTDISKDGMLTGPSTDLYKEILSECQVNLIASGGVVSLNDIEILKTIGCEAVIIGKAIYEGRINIKDLGKLC
ncbi:MAG: 1-(5-phosphoribosyl)-5-[(5-phosphoribosylamino)methylideneamino]imidazole-4-carboxamide isomerase [Ferruginibacter sp.]